MNIDLVERCRVATAPGTVAVVGWCSSVPGAVATWHVSVRNGGKGVRERVDGEGGLLFVDDQWRRETDRRRAGAEDEQAALEAFVDDRVAHRRDFFTRGAIFDDLDSQHQTQSANVTNRGMLAHQPFEPRLHE